MLNELIIARAALRPSLDLDRIGERHCAVRSLFRRIAVYAAGMTDALRAEGAVVGHALGGAVDPKRVKHIGRGT